MDPLTNKTIREEAENMSAALSSSPGDQKINPSHFLMVLQAACLKTKDAKIWSMYYEGTEGGAFRNLIFAGYNSKSLAGKRDTEYLTQFEFFSKIKKDDLLLNFCAYLLVKLFDAKTFDRNGKIDNHQRKKVLGDDIMRRYTSVSKKLPEPKWRLRLSIPDTQEYKDAFPFASTESVVCIAPDFSDDEDTDVVHLKAKWFDKVQSNLLEEKSTLTDELKEVAGQLEEVNRRIQDLKEEEDMVAMVKSNSTQLHKLLQSSDDNLDACFGVFKKLLQICKEKAMDDDKFLEMCLNKRNKYTPDEKIPLDLLTEYSKFPGADVSAILTVSVDTVETVIGDNTTTCSRNLEEEFEAAGDVHGEVFLVENSPLIPDFDDCVDPCDGVSTGGEDFELDFLN